MDLNKISEQTIMYIVTAIAVMIIAVGVRYASILAGVDVGTANLLFVIVLAVELVLYLLLHKSIDKATAFFVLRRKKSEKCKPNELTGIAKERFEQSIAIFADYTKLAFNDKLSGEDIERLCSYAEQFAKEEELKNIAPIKVLSRKISNNDLYHYGWNLWNHFRSYRDDRRQECVVAWLKTVFDNLSAIETSTVKGKLTIFDSKCNITIQKNISDYLRIIKG